MRDGHNYTEEDFLKHYALLREKIPGHKFDDTHERIFHSTDNCYDGNPFEHPDRKTYE